jgi:amino acid adenylation domain-containing protein
MSASVFGGQAHDSELSPQQRLAWDVARAGQLPMLRVWLRVGEGYTAERLRAALEQVGAAHAILRMRLERDARFKYPLASLAGTPLLGWSELDLRHLAEAGQREQLRLAAELRVPAEQALPLEVTVARVGETARVVVLSLPALYADAASVVLLVDAWNAALTGFSRGDASGESPIEYAEFATWQNELAASAYVPGPASAALTLPFEATSSAPPVVAHLEHSLPAALGIALGALAERHGVSLAALCQAVFRAQLARLLDRAELPFAGECAGRDFADVRELLGPVARYHLLTCSVQAELDHAQLQQAADAIARAADDDLPLGEDATKELAQRIGFAFRGLGGAASGPLQLTRLECDPVGPRHVLAVHQHAQELRVALAFDTVRLSEAGASIMIEQYASALREIAASPGLPCALRFASGGMEASGECGRACREAPAELLHEAFARNAAQHPARLAVVSGSETLSYAQLERRANQLARRLRRLGVRREEPVGLWAERQASAVVGLLGILKAGGAYVPLDPEAPPERLREQLRTSGLRWLVTGTAGCAVAGEVLEIACDDASLRDEGGGDVCAAPALDELASLIFTSGSTGAPKAVAITQRAIASYARAILELLALPEPAHFGVVSTLSADLGNTSVFGALASGGTLHVIDYATVTDGRAFADYCARWPLDVLKIVPSHLAALLDAGHERAILPRRALVLGGEAFSPALRARIEALAPSCALINHYGPTETTVGACALPLAELHDARGAATIPIGTPLANAQALVLDARLARVPIGAVGELYLGGAGLARGYHGRPDLTAERFVPHPFADGERLYRTGDRARYRPDRSIEFMGRRDDQLKVRGFRVELGEIEARLREYPAVSAAAVVARPSAAGHTLTGFLVPRTGTLDEQALRAHLRAHLPGYMIPQELVTLTSLPLTKNGKLDRAALAKLGPEVLRPYRPPASDCERVIARVWSELLGVARIGVDDDFFALGGHSLLAIPLIHRIREALDVTLSLGALFERPTIAGLAEKLAASPPTGVTLLHAAGPKPALYVLDPTGFHASAYLGLAQALADRSTYALELSDLLAAEQTPALGALAHRLAQRIRRQQPGGPYHLLGWSLGGVLAVATARALESAGEVVAFVGILDTHPRTELYAYGEPDAFEELAAYLPSQQAAALQHLPESARGELRRAVAGASGPARVAAAVRWAQRAAILSDDTPAELFHSRYALLRAAAEYMRALPAGALASDMQVIWSQETRARLQDAATRWQRFTRGAISEHVVPGDHEAALQSREAHAHVARALAGA